MLPYGAPGGNARGKAVNRNKLQTDAMQSPRAGLPVGFFALASSCSSQLKSPFPLTTVVAVFSKNSHLVAVRVEYQFPRGVPAESDT